MLSTHIVQEFLAGVTPFKSLSAKALTRVAEKVEFLRYEMGQPILVRERLPAKLYILYQGQARLLGYEPKSDTPVTLQRLDPGAIVGWVGLVRGVACETAIASTDAVCLTLSAEHFLAILNQEAEVAAYFHNQPAMTEVFDVLAIELEHRADRDLVFKNAGVKTLKELSLRVLPQSVIHNLSKNPGQFPSPSPSSPSHPSPHTLHPDWSWFVSGGAALPKSPVGSYVNPSDLAGPRSAAGMTRLLGVPATLLTPAPEATNAPPPQPHPFDVEAAVAPEYPAEATLNRRIESLSQKNKRYPFVRGKGDVRSGLACFQMLGLHLSIPFRRDLIRRMLINQHERSGSLSLQTCGAVAEMMGIQAQLVKVPLKSISRLQAPALIRWQNGFAILYEISDTTIVLADPERGILRYKPKDLLLGMPAPLDKDTKQPAQDSLYVLLLQQTRDTPVQKFGLSWFLPSLYRYRWVLIEVLLVSFFVQLFGLANPLMTQIIIDKVLVQNSPGTLQVLGIFLIVIATFEAILTSLRTYLFVDTTNRIDLALGSEIINHLLRLPLRYFDRRPVGELASRMSELEQIRQFLTTTALTVVMDAVFSVIYIAVMFTYSWALALVALASLPLFALLTALVSPIVRQQLRHKAERHAETQSYLVEVLSGIQTVKAQNIELRSRWQWQERYTRYVNAGFRTVLTHTAAGSTSQFLNQVSSLLVLWVGAYLVLQGDLSLGQLIAFRIIAGYVTSPLLRLTQLWQNFQETALSLERLSDIIDTPTESDDLDRQNITLPPIEGHVSFENVLFRFNSTGPLQLNNISLDFQAGSFVGIVGLSGSGKSTLMKLLPRLYPLESGRILIDGYDINKVELYSLRRQVGIVPQDTLLFEGTIQENIALNHPDASPEEIITAAKVAAAHEFIMDLPNGYNTRVGERGTGLSGGQRQRIAIARTVLQDPRLLILDEATSALDYESERQVCLNLAAAFKDRTVFFITHRLSTIRNADVILMMDKGIAVEQGTHEELMAMQGRYYCLFRQQESQL